MKKLDISNFLYYLFYIIAFILIIRSLFFNDNSHSFLAGIIIIGINILRKIR